MCLRRACNLIEFIIHAKGHFLLVYTNPYYTKIIKQIWADVGKTRDMQSTNIALHNLK